jgi:hypothetical protein
MKRTLAGFAALVLAASPIAAFADNGCFGCNVRDAGVFDQNLVGQTVYAEGGFDAWGRVVRINRETRRVSLRLENGDIVETHAAEIYTRASRNERTNATVVGVAAVAALAVCVLGACGDDAPSSADEELLGAP